MFEVCTAPDNPGWRETKPSFVHVADQPDPYRGAFGDDAARLRRLGRRRLRRGGDGAGGVAAFISEPMLGNQGAVEPPAGFLRGAYAAVRAAGGVCIADEIQVGYGRTGETFWAFEHEGVAPDIVAVAKAAGNGHPARRGHLPRRDRRGVRPPGGVLLLDRRRTGLLRGRARRARRDRRRGPAGERRARRRCAQASLTALAERHELIGAVHGRGLYLGVDLVLDRDTREPAVAQARWICERMRELGVVVQPTGDDGNVLKVKPPLCLTEDAAELFVAALDRVLGELATAGG